MLRYCGVLAVLASAVACAQQEPVHRPAMAASATADVLLRAENAVIESRVPRHATLDSLLRQHRLPAELVNVVVRSAASVFNPRQLRADRPYRLVLSFDGFLREFEYEIDADRLLRIISRDRTRPDLLEAEVVPFEKQTEVVAVSGAIDGERSSLVAAMDAAGENIQLAMTLADVFGGQIDFNSDLQKGDRFEVLVEKSTRDGQFVGYGDILGATFVTDGRRLQAFRWVNPETGEGSYYDEEGRSLKRFFLVSPLKFEPRVTSRFSRSRLHPVLNTVRAHTGVDYRAPHGAAVVAVADGTVVSAAWSGGGGKQVRIRHAGGLETSYLHLSSYGPGIRPGARVEQGQTIGRVGATGTATGPHLHFSLRKNNTFVDPVAERRRQPPGRPVPPAYLDAFVTARDGLLQQIGVATLADDAPRQSADAVTAAR